MTTDSEDRYDIAFAGECLEGHEPAAVREAMGRLFKADDTTLDRLFSGKRQPIKRGCDRPTAAKYQKAMAAAGARALVTLSTDEASARANHAAANAAGNSQEPSQGPSQSASQDTSQDRAPGSSAQRPAKAETSLDLLPSGSDLLRPDERRHDEAPALDLTHLSVAAGGESLTAQSTPAPPSVEAPALEVAEVGAQIGPTGAQPAPPAPDTSALDLAPLGEDLVEATTGKSTEVDTTHLSVAEAGSDLLNENERKHDQNVAPDTSHLALDDGDPTSTSSR